MTYSVNKTLEKVYAARSDNERARAYDEWAENYDRDVTQFGIQLPYVGASVFARFVELEAGPILDAGCGTGMHSLPLKLMGYSGFHGIDLSEGMLEIARARHIYDSLQRMALGGALAFSDAHFAVTYCIGCIAPGNAPANSLDEFLRVTKPNGLIIWSTHDNGDVANAPVHDYRASLTAAGKWALEFETGPFISMPKGDSNIKHNIFVYRVSE